MKRMILVPEDAYARFKQKQKLETSPIMKNMINTDTDMTDILQRTDVDDTEKQKLYYANLEKYDLRQQKCDLRQQNDVNMISDNKKTVKHQPCR